MILPEKQSSDSPDWNFLPEGGEMGSYLRSKDWAQTAIGSPNRWPQSLRTALDIILGSKFPMLLMWGPELICFYNDAFRPSLGKDGKHPGMLGQKAQEGWAEIWTTIQPLFNPVLSGAGSVWNEDQLIPIFRNGRIENVWWTFSYSPVKSENGKIAGLFVTCFETTDKVNILQNLQASDQRFKNLIREANIGIVVLSGKNMIVDIINEAYGRLIDRTSDEMLGRPLFDIIPHAEDPFRKLLDQVRITGIPLYLYGRPYLVYTNGKKIEGFIDLTYQPYRESDGSITGVIALIRDVTESTLSRKKIEEAEEKARLAIDSADLGTYEIDLSTDDMITSERFDAIRGISSAMSRAEIVERIHPEDRELRATAHGNSLRDGHLAYEARVIWTDESIHCVKVKGKMLYDGKQNPVTLIGVVQDITEQKEFSHQLSAQVKDRTLELRRSNDDLLQFAHVISHDLKEPIRKIKTFINRIMEEMSDQVPDKAFQYCGKIKTSVTRMEAMVEGVLNYSTLFSLDGSQELIDLNEIILNIQTELELPTRQKSAQIVYSELPTIRGATILVHQLFYNLINNSLKFSRKDIPPLIIISSLSYKEAQTEFTEIKVADNGIGFDQEYAGIIFNSFARLNSKDAYEGTGLGLALSKKIVERHGGSISAISSQGKGATFILKLPLNRNSI